MVYSIKQLKKNKAIIIIIIEYYLFFFFKRRISRFFMHNWVLGNRLLEEDQRS